MQALAHVKELALRRVIEHLVSLAARDARKDPDRTLRRMLRAATLLTRDPLWRAVLTGLRDRLDAGHPAMHIARRFLTQFNPQVRRVITRNLFIEDVLLGPRRRHALEHELGYYPPGTMVVSPSMWCPLRCYGCYAGSYDPKDSLSLEDMESILKQAYDIGMRFLVISGGEPFAWPPLMQMLQRHPEFLFQVFTSGLLLDDRTVDRIAELGNCFPAVSCEGFEAETDARRGPGAFRKVLRAMDRLRDRGAPFTFSATVTRRNFEVVTGEEFIDFWVDRGCLVGWYFIYMPIGRQPHLDLMPTPDQRVEMSWRIKRYRSTKGIFLVDFWNDGEHAGGCIAGARKYLHINNRGDVEPCVFCHFATDNIRTTPLAEAMNSAFFRAIKSRQPYNDDLRRPCLMIDNPGVLREVCAETGARGTHPGAESLLQEFFGDLEAYSEAFGAAVRERGPVGTFTHRV
jgi:MoaA/NifB/PqqE/SkfB family radical SAM enzyme